MAGHPLILHGGHYHNLILLMIDSLLAIRWKRGSVAAVPIIFFSPPPHLLINFNKPPNLQRERGACEFECCWWLTKSMPSGIGGGSGEHQQPLKVTQRRYHDSASLPRRSCCCVLLLSLLLRGVIWDGGGETCHGMQNQQLQLGATYASPPPPPPPPPHQHYRVSRGEAEVHVQPWAESHSELSTRESDTHTHERHQAESKIVFLGV